MVKTEIATLEKEFSADLGLEVQILKGACFNGKERFVIFIDREEAGSVEAQIKEFSPEELHYKVRKFLGERSVTHVIAESVPTTTQQPKTIIHEAGKSRTECMLGIIKCLKEVEKLNGIGSNLNWKSKNDFQRAVITWLLMAGNQLSGVWELEAIASFNIGEINQFLVDKGYPDVQLDRLSDLGVAAVLDLMVEWSVPGKESTFEYEGEIYPAVSMKNEENTVKFFQSKYSANPVACLSTKDNKTSVYMTVWEGNNPQADITELGTQVASCKSHLPGYKGLRFPMADVNDSPNIEEILGLACKGEDDRPLWIDQAKQKNRIRMNQFGARAQSVTAMGMSRSISFDKTMVIDRPFLVWFMREGISIPLIAALVYPDSWKNPGNLND